MFRRKAIVHGDDNAAHFLNNMKATGMFTVEVSECEPASMNKEESRHHFCSVGRAIEADGNGRSTRRTWDATIFNSHSFEALLLSCCGCHQLCHPSTGGNRVCWYAAEEGLHLDEG
jgi:hypothetical protein